MGRGNRSLDLIGAGAIVPHRLVDQREALGDQLGVPSAAILIVEQDHVALVVEPRGQPRLLQQHQRGESHDLGLGLKQP